MSESPKKEDITIQSFIESVKSCKKPSFISLNYDKKTLLDDYNYILTEKAKDRLDKLYTYISKGIPVLLEGETGTSKTLSSEIICKYIFENKKKENPNIENDTDFIKFNLSAEVKINDLMQKFMGNKNSLSGLEIVDGPFIKAFKGGIPLILDEINLASEEVLQCIEEALDSGEINMEISGIGNVNYKKKEGFCLIATQNPNRDNYMNKRQNLSKSFLSHFQIIKFPPFEIEELKEIAENLFRSFNNNIDGDEKDNKFISDLINFHKIWTSKEERKSEIACFTIREIAATVKAYIDEGKQNPFKIVKVIYASRYPSNTKKELLNLLGSFETFKNEYEKYSKDGSSYVIPEEIKGFYVNEILKEALESSLFSLQKGRNIIITGEYGIGKSHISRQLAKIFNKENDKEENKFCHFICTEETKCSDLIGGQVPKEYNGKDVYMEWKDGFLTNAIENGEFVILDNLQEANSTITERLNSLLDIKYNENKKKGSAKKFDIPENPLKSVIEIHKDFRIIGICDILTINQMSPAFLNRFDIIVLENQIKNISEEDMVSLLQTLINRSDEKSVSEQKTDAFLDDFLNEDDDKKNEEQVDYNQILGEEDIKYLSSKIVKHPFDDSIKEINDIKKSLSLSEISRFCYSIKILLTKKGDEFKDIPKKNIVDFIYDILFNENDIIIKDDQIKNILLESLKKQYQKLEKNGKNEEKISNFIYSGNETLENYLSLVYASYLINLHLCIIGPPGVGKTSSAKFISELLYDEKNYYKFFPFHRNTKISELYGTMSLKGQKMEHYDGPLIESAQRGCIFIADEMNLSSISTMKSIVPLLDPLLRKGLLLPGVDSSIDIDDKFFFIVCQNDLDNLGRNCIPEMLQRKLRNLNYPKQTDEEIKNICKKKRIKEFGVSEEFSEHDAELLGEFMRKYNSKIDEYKLPLLKWSFRDIGKIIKRISEHIKDKNYINFEYYHFIYFYLLSPIPKILFNKEYSNQTLKNIIHDLFIKSFKIENKSDELLEIYFTNPKVDLEKNLLKKGNISINFDKLTKIFQEEINFDEEFSSYYDDLFKLKLISKNEPVLLMGPSSYKTYLSKFFIKEISNSNNFNVINLNQKTTIEELLGGPDVLPPMSYPFFDDLLKEIIEYNEDDNGELREKLQNMRNKIDQYSNNAGKYKILNNLLKHFEDNYKKYLDMNGDVDNINRNKNSLPQLVFKPGSILLSILKEESIIFKNVHEVSTEIFERFNELFASERILSLNEDIYGTLFKNEEIDKSINLKSLNSIYIFATCPENSFQSLSESVISRFSVICVGEHGKKEKQRIIKNYSKKCNYLTIDILNVKLENLINDNFSDINKLKNLIDIFDEMNKNNINNYQESDKINNNLKYAMHRIKLNNKLNSYEELPQLKKEESPLSFKNNFLISNVSDLKIYSPQLNDKDFSEITFTQIFNDIADLLHFGICTGTPIILEGFPGQGKQKAINYISDLLNYDIENIVITNDFSKEDLYKKKVLESKGEGNIGIDIVDTKLYKLLTKSPYQEKDKQNFTIFIFHNIQKARADVLSEISNILNKKTVNCNYYFIGILNRKESFIERNSYYYTYFYNSIYYIVNFTKITSSFDKEIKIPPTILSRYNNQENYENADFTLTDINKYISLKKISGFDDGFLEEILFKNKYGTNKENNSKNINQKRNQPFDLDIIYRNLNKILSLELNNKSISLDTSVIFDKFEIEKNTLSFEQKKCLIVLGLSVKIKKPCILQGPTGVGKSHLIKLFARLLGKKLNIIEMNKDNDISLLTKRYVFKNYEEKEEIEIKNVINEILGNSDDNNRDLQEITKKLMEADLNNLDENKKKKFEELKSKFKFIHRFKYDKSNILKAVEEGEWILLDGIENAPSSIIEKVTLLCGDKPELNLYESGQKSIEPAKGFHLFMTYNPNRINHNDSISNILLDKCLIYYLDSFLNSRQAISQIIDGFLVNSNYSINMDLIQAISSKISNIHNKINNKIKNEEEKISERSLIKFCQNWTDIKGNKKDLPSFLKNNFLYFYFPSGNIEVFNQMIDDTIVEEGIEFKKLAKTYRTECKETLFLIDILKENIINSKNYELDIGKLIFSCLDIPFEYLEIIVRNLKEVINEAENLTNKCIYLPIKNLIKYLDEINISFQKNQAETMNKITIRKATYFPKIRLLLLFEKLYNNNLISWDCCDILYQNINIFNTFRKLFENQNLDSLGIFFEELILNIKYIQDIIKIFPYLLFKGTKFSLLNEIVSIVIQNTAIKKINFKIKIKDKEYYFKYIKNENDMISILLDLNLNDANELIITTGTKVIISLVNKNKEIPVSGIKNDKLNNFFLKLIERGINTQINKKNFKDIYKNIIKNLDNTNSNISNYNFQNLFKNKNNSNNLVVNIWSILFLNVDDKNYFDNLLPKLERNIFKLLIEIKNEILREPSNIFTELDKIIDMSKELIFLLENKRFIVILLNNEKYIDSIDLNSIEERKKLKEKIENEINDINAFIEKYKDFTKVNQLFISYRQLLEKEKSKIIKEIDQLEIQNYKERIEKKIELGFSLYESLKSNLLKKLKKKDKFEEIKEFDRLIDNYLIKYNNKKEEKIIIFSENDMNENILDIKENNNSKLIEILLKYSKIKDILDDIFDKRENIYISLQKLNDKDINISKYSNFFNSILLKDKIIDENKNNINEYFNAMFAQEIIYNSLIENLIKIKGLFNNLYDIQNSEKINKNWCVNIEKKYNICSNIYMPNLNGKSFLKLYIREKDESDKEKGFLIDTSALYNNDDILLYDNIFNDLINIYSTIYFINDKKKIILEIGNVLFRRLIKQEQEKFNDLENLCQNIEDYIKKNKENKNNLTQQKLNIFSNYLNAKKLYLNYDNDEKLLFNDINTKENRNELYINNCPSLFNYLNCNQDIYDNLLTKSNIKKYKFRSDSIPLWLICLRNLANMNNIKPLFNYYDDIFLKFEKEFTKKLKENFKKNYLDIYWVLLLSPNYNNLLENKYYERLYKFFNFLLYEITFLSSENKKKFYNLIKRFIFDIFDDAYNKGFNHFLKSNENKLFELNNKISKQIKKVTNLKFKDLNDSTSMANLKTFSKEILNDKNKESFKNLILKLKNELQIFENQYIIEYKKNLIQKKFSNMKNSCDEYNNLIDKYQNNERTNEEINNLLKLKDFLYQKYIRKKDVRYIKGDIILSNNVIVQKVECIQQEEYIDKYKSYGSNKKFNYFEEISAENIESLFKSLIENFKTINNLLNSLNKINIHSLIEIKKLKETIEKNIKLFCVNGQCDQFIVQKIYSNNQINIDILYKNILYQLNNMLGYIKIILNDLDNYEKDKDIFILNYMQKEYNIYIPKENYFQEIRNNNKEELRIINEDNIIPYYSIENNKIFGLDEIKYDLGILNLSDCKFQNIYLVAFDKNINCEFLKKSNDVKVIQRNNLLILNVKIMEKKEEDIENINIEGTIKFNFNEKSKIINYYINYQLEAMKIYLNCDKYKLKYLEKSKFKLNTQILFIDEIINFSIENLNHYFDKNENNFKINLITFKDNTCIKPIINQYKKGFSLQIKYDSENHENDFLSCSVCIFICQRYKFYIEIKSQVKPIDFDFLISKDIKEGFLNKKILCPFEESEDFDFILYIGISQNRLCDFKIEKIYDKKLIQIDDINQKSFLESIQINIHVKLLKKVETNIKLKAKIDNKIKELEIIFTDKNKINNFGYKVLENELNNNNNDNSGYFSFTLNEITAHGTEEDKYYYLNNKDYEQRKKPQFIKSNNFKNIVPNLKLKEIDIKVNMNVEDIFQYYNRISEEARLLPIYCLNYKNENIENQKLIKKNYHILESIYEDLIHDNVNDIKFYENNYFYGGICEFISSFNYLKSVVEFGDKDLIDKVEKILNFIKNHKNWNLGGLSWLEKYLQDLNTKKLKEILKKLNLNADEFVDKLYKTNFNEQKEKISLNKINENFNLNENNILNENKANDLKDNNIANNNKKNNDDIQNKNYNKINDSSKNNKDKKEEILKKLNKDNNKSKEDNTNSLVEKNKNKEDNNSKDKDDIKNKEKEVIENDKEKEKEVIENDKEKEKEKKNIIDEGKKGGDEKEELKNNNNEKNDDIFNNLLDMLKNEAEKNQNINNQIPDQIKDKDNSFLNQDIWKQNKKQNFKSKERNIIDNNDIDDFINGENPDKISSGDIKMNTREDIKKEIRNNKNNKIHIKKALPNIVNSFDPLNCDIGIIFADSETDIRDKTEFTKEKHDFEKKLKINNDNDEQDSKGIPQLMTNKQMNLLLPLDKKENFLEKIYQDNENNKIEYHMDLEDKDEGLNEFDEGLIDKIISEIKNKENEKEDEFFDCITENPVETINLKKKKKNNRNYIVKDLISFSRKYMEKFLELMTKTNINYKKISFCFIIDSSIYLGLDIKLYNLMAILSIIKLFYIIDIEFSILLSADDKFKVIIKNYDENINFEDLIEILYESMIVKRFRNDILKATKAAIESLKNKNRFTIYIAFFDCIDESLLYHNYWSKNILTDKKNTFILITEESKLYKENNKEKKEIFDNLIKSFDENIQKNSISKIKIINSNFGKKNFNLEKLFSEILNFLNNIHDLTTPLENIELNNDNKNKKIELIEPRQNLSMKNFEYFEELVKNNFYKDNDKIYFAVKKNMKKPKINLSEYSMRIANIEIPKYEKNEFPEDNKFFNMILKNHFLDKTLIESIFYPNRATQKILSTKGTEIDVMALILYTLKPIQEPMIYLENKGGLVRDYSITIIIDNSKSCFSEFNERHSFLTMINLFHIVNSMAIPSLDIILTTRKGEQPDILLFDKPSITIFKNYSIFEKLLTLLSNPVLTTDLSEAMNVVYELKKKKRNDRDSYLFVLTDGLSCKGNEQEIDYFSSLCQNIGIKIFGIGLGIFPYCVKSYFDIFIYSVNPEQLLKAISKYFGKIIKTERESELELISDNNKNIGNLEEIFNKIKSNKEFYYEDLIKELESIEKGDDVFNIFKNAEKQTDDKFPSVEIGENLEIYSKNILKTQKILMVMLWSFDLNKKGESEYVSPKYIYTPSETNGVCIQSAVEFFGIESVIVVDYENAIKELLEKNEKGECNYYAVWVFCGPQYPVFPPINGEKNTSNPNLIEEFINVLIEFWNNGGALFFMADGDPLNFQVNLFLEKIDFSKDEKPDFRIHGNYIGGKYLIQDKEGKMNKESIFNKSNHKIDYKGKKIQRQSLSHNLGQIYEGYTISYAVDKQNKKITFSEFKKLLPFKAFAINSEGGISTLIYEADSKGRGDILIDCGYTKCFFNMFKSGTYRFIQNIAGWTARPEIIFLAENINPWDWRPKGINYKVNYNAVYNGFLKLENEEEDLMNMKTLFCIDDSGSTENVSFYYNELKDIIEKYYIIDRGDIFYLWSDRSKKITYEELEQKIKTKDGNGGTYPYLIADIIDEEKNNNCRHLLIITDGNVDQCDILKADEKIKKISYNFDYVTIYILGEDADLSVGAPFCRNTPNKTFSKKRPGKPFKKEITLSKKDISTIKHIEEYDNYDKFKDNYDKIYKAVQAKCIGTSDTILKEKLEKMFDKIKKSENIDLEFIEKSQKVLIGMTEGSIKNKFTLDKINAATSDFLK